MEKESVVKRYYDAKHAKIVPVLPPYNRFHCCLSLLVVRLLEHGFLFLNWSGRVEYIIIV